MTALLECRGLVGGYGSTRVVHGVDIAIGKGSVLAVLGPNGAGKTTLLLTLAGMLQRLDGEVLLDGQVLGPGRAAAANRAGLVLVPDDRSLFTTLSVKDNLKIARRKDGVSLDEMGDLFPALTARWKLAAGSLSGGEQQMLAVARALVQRPRALLIDEMSMGLAPVVMESLLPVVRQIADSTGAVVVLVEQHVRLALEVADEAIVLVHGEVHLRGSAADLLAAPESIEAAYLGVAGDSESVAAGGR